MSELGLHMEVEPPRRRDPEKRGRGAVVLAVLVFVFVLLGIGALFLRYQVFPGTGDDYSGAGGKEVIVQVHEGQTISDIGVTLKEEGVVASARSFVDAAARNDQSQSIGPGYYRLAERMSGEAALNAMLDPDSLVVTRVVIPEGLRLDQVVKRLSKATDIPSAKFRSVLKDADKLGLPKFAKGNPEGFLFPATYEFAPRASARDMIKALLARYNEAAQELDFVKASKKTGYSPYKVMVIASLVQAEGHPDDYGKVSRVIYNRLAAGMPLQLDATVNYALRKSDINLSHRQLATRSPYNTYKRKGLPPTPINQPGEAAMQAALTPEKGDWLYFVAVNPDTGETKFTDNYDEFLKFKAEFEKYISENP
ncbi:MAG: endolytic transglycosylase MltG [Candidatus Nanopelagicales bacterium]